MALLRILWKMSGWRYDNDELSILLDVRAAEVSGMNEVSLVGTAGSPVAARAAAEASSIAAVVGVGPALH